LLMTTAQHFKMAALPLLSIGIGGLLLIVACRRLSTSFRQLMDRFKLMVPGLGSLVLLVDTSRFVYTLHILFTTGVPLLQSLAQAQQSIKNSWLQEKLYHVQIRIMQGELLSTAIIHEGIFAGLLPRFLAVGEQAGSLAQALEQADHLFNQTLKRRLEMMVTLAEPVLIMFLGLILIWIAYAIFMPLYEHLGAVT
jgi:type II secretory pathway component PulF